MTLFIGLNSASFLLLVSAAVVVGGVVSSSLSDPEELQWQENSSGRSTLSAQNNHAFPAPSKKMLEEHRYGIHFFVFKSTKLSNGTIKYSRQEIIIGDKESLRKANLVPGESINIYSPGFLGTSNAQREFTYKVAKVYKKFGFKNVIVVQWETAPPVLGEIPIIQFSSYFSAMWKYLPKTCAVFTNFVQFLLRNGIQLRQLHLVGLSLGAHLSGCVGNTLAQTGYSIPRITGLDPAGPFNTKMDPQTKLNKDSAKFVDVIHTDIDGFGIPDQLGDADFYINGGLGANQNGCSNDPTNPISVFSTIICAHPRAVEIWAYTIYTNVTLYGYPCAADSTNTISLSPTAMLDVKMNTVCKRPKQFKKSQRERVGEYLEPTTGKYYVVLTKSAYEDMQGLNL